MKQGNSWTRDQLLIAFKLYCQIPFGKMHSRNPQIIEFAEIIGRTPSALAMKLTNIASLDPSITSTGKKGLTGASITDKTMWDEMKNDWEAFLIAIASAEVNFDINTDKEIASEILPTITTDSSNIDYSSESKLSQVAIRIGQNFFRQSVLSAYNFSCCISGLNTPQLLIASHIIPWRNDKQNRLNPSNGLCLSVLHDKAFDIGIITITENLTVKVADDFKTNKFNLDPFFSTTILKFDGVAIRKPEKFLPASEFLSYHRTNIFRG